MILKGRTNRGGRAVYRVRWRENGILVQRTCHSLEAARVLDAQRVLRRQQASPPVSQKRRNTTLAVFADQWLAQLDVTAKTRSSYREMLHTYIVPVLGSWKIRQIHQLHLRSLLVNATKRNGEPLAKNTRRLIRATLSSMFGDALEEGIVSTNPVTGIARRGRKQPGVLSPADRQRTIRAMTYEQLNQFLQAVDGHCQAREALLFHTLAALGLRPSEALRLKWRDIDIVQRRLDVEATKTGERRTMSLPKHLASAFGTWQARGEAEALTSKERRSRIPNPYVFPSKRTGMPLDVKTVGRRYRALLRKAGLPKFKLYDLRHTFASHLLDQGWKIIDVAKLMGHRKPTTTWHFYAHWIERDDAGDLDRLAAARDARR
jgi:integrase